jgi:transposase
MDVHKNSISVAMLRPGAQKPLQWQEENKTAHVRRLVHRLKQEGTGEVVCAYEAGPCGYMLKRELERHGVRCQVVAPSLIPVRVGDRVKTDKRDAYKLAEMLKAGLLTEVHAPSPEQEAVRDLCRCREDVREDLLRARHRLSKMLLRRGLVWTGSCQWTQAHRQWLRGLKFEHAAARAAFEAYVEAVTQLEQRQRDLEKSIEEVAQQEPYRAAVGAVSCFRGVKTVTALTFVAELLDLQRFQSPRQLMAYLGLTPSEYSSGDMKSRGSITKAGNRHVRRVLVEASWHYRHPPVVGAALRKRRQGQPAWAIAIADKAQKRLNKRFMRLVLQGNKAPAKAVVAVARELTGFLWAVLTTLEVENKTSAATVTA